MRLLFALRFRDLDLLISDQVTADSQLLFHRSLADRLPRIAPFLRYDKDPYLVIDGDGRLVYVQDAYTMSRPLPARPGVRPARRSRRPASAATRSTTSATASRSRWTPTTARCTSTSPTRPTRSSAPSRASSRRCSSRSTSCRRTCAPHLRVPEELFNVQTRMFGQYHVTEPADVLPERRPVDRPDRPGQRAEPAVRGLLRGHADARRAGGRVPAAPADDPARAGRT